MNTNYNLSEKYLRMIEDDEFFDVTKEEVKTLLVRMAHHSCAFLMDAEPPANTANANIAMMIMTMTNSVRENPFTFLWVFHWA